MAQSQDASTVLDQAASESDLLRAVARVSDADVPATVWARVANDSTYGLFHRRVCVFELFRRHVHPGSTATDIARLLDHPTWLLDEHIRALQDVGGRTPPVTLNFEDSVFTIHVLPGPEPVADLWSVYLRMRGHVDRDAFARLLRDGTAAATDLSAVVLEIGFLRP